MPFITDVTPAKLATLVFLVILLIIIITKLYVLSDYTVVQVPLG